MESRFKYLDILKNICYFYNIEQEEIMELLKNRENRYLLLLILKRNNCLEIDKVKKIFNIKTVRSINTSLRLAEEKLLINKIFREKYFELERNIEKNDLTNL